MRMNDASQGFRTDSVAASTQWPCALALAASFDPSLAFEQGSAVAQEQVLKGANVILGPGVNVARVPQNGRNFEQISGEDPILGSKLVAEQIRGVRSQNVIPTTKHQILNNQETNRDSVSANIDQRTLQEVQFRPFKAAVDAGTLAVMCSYNKINGDQACENEMTLQLLKTSGFEGFVMSDWGGTHSTVKAAAAGLDMEMPGDQQFGSALLDAVNSGQVSVQTIDDKVTRILTAFDRVGLLNKPQTTGDPYFDTTIQPRLRELARKVASESAILLSNNGILPISIVELAQKKIAFQNRQCTVNSNPAGDGSGHVLSKHVVTPQEAFAPFNPTFVTRPELLADQDLVVLCTQSRDNTSEGSDRSTLALDDGHIQQVLAQNKNVIVLAVLPGPAMLPWTDSVQATVAMILPGEVIGSVFLDVVTGAVNPSGRLPFTIPLSENDMGFTQEQYPGVNLNASYSEGLNVGYKWYSANNKQVKQPFGFGLSQSAFSQSDISISTGNSIVVSVTVTNTSQTDGQDVVQVQVDVPDAAEPPKQLKGFSKVFVRQQSKETVFVEIEIADLKVWTTEWTLVQGTQKFQVANNVQDIIQTVEVDLGQNTFLIE